MTPTSGRLKFSPDIRRLIAWTVLAIASGWFVWTSPKTPIAFFDAANADREQWHNLAMTRRATGNPSLSDRLLDCRIRQARIALEYDIVNSPEHVAEERESIIVGYYTPTPQTDTYLCTSNAQYKALAARAAEYRATIAAERELSRSANPKPASTNEHLEASLLRMEIDSLMLREFQSKLFWRRKR